MSDGRMEAILEQAFARCADAFLALQQTELDLQRRVLDAFRKHRVATQHMAGTTGYGYDDIGRDTLEKVYAEVLGCEDALVRPHIVSGTHALGICLYGLLSPGDVLLSAAGKPYDTLDEIIGTAGNSRQSLRRLGVSYRQAELLPDGKPDIAEIRKQATEVRVVLIQRSRGYNWRPSLSLPEIRQIAEAVRDVSPNALIMVDNCYGEFVEAEEPSFYGADVLVGSLIKNIGGGLAPTGGYIAGKKVCIEAISDRWSTPGIGREVGSYEQGYRLFYQGLFLAPHVVSQALHTAIYAASVFDLLKYPVSPAFDAPRHDIIQAIEMGERERLLAFCEAIQETSPVDSFVTPEPWGMPGYQDQVVMAAGAFVGGASIELSADAPIKPPFVVYLQGGLTGAHGRLAVEAVVERLWISNKK